MRVTHRQGRRRAAASLACAIAALAALGTLPAGCRTDAQTGLVAGAGIGALMGQAIGGNTTGTLIGTAVGGGIGYIIGNERDKARSEQMWRAQQASPPPATAQPAGSWSAVDRPVHTEVAPLGGTRWMLVSVNPRDAAPPHASLLVEFRENGRVLTTTTLKDGTVEVADESYRVVGETLIVNRPGYLINARFSISASEMVISADRFSAVLRRLPS
jgi:hypothetical protein